MECISLVNSNTCRIDVYKFLQNLQQIIKWLKIWYYMVCIIWNFFTWFLNTNFCWFQHKFFKNILPQHLFCITWFTKSLIIRNLSLNSFSKCNLWKWYFTYFTHDSEGAQLFKKNTPTYLLFLNFCLHILFFHSTTF